MRILFDSKKTEYKSPFGVLRPKQVCTLNIRIPADVDATAVDCILCGEDGHSFDRFPLFYSDCAEGYHRFTGAMVFQEVGLYFYYFRISGKTGPFRLFRQGCDTNMEAGDLWQVSCVPPADVPAWAENAIIYQVFPDRFCKKGDPDLTGKLTPYSVHKAWSEEVCWQPDEKGTVLNNDFYGGNFQGIIQKLDYIASFGTTILYLNPICKAFSSHRYDTADYKAPDPMLGTEADFRQLCAEARKRNIRVILDGVFSHTGDNSIYFNRQNAFSSVGAYQSKESPYYDWYEFRHYPDTYRCWWNFDTLPTVNKLSPSFEEYVITGEDSVIAYWLSLGADGFRLDVADELPDEFLHKLKVHLRKLKPDALLMGEVWEDASAKIAYGIRRRYFTDGQLDSVMNYPFRTALLNFFSGRDDGTAFWKAVEAISENYPPEVLACCMNMLGTHDTPRILTALVDEFDGPREQAAVRVMDAETRQRAEKMLLCASALQYLLPGSPAVYYGDEAGMEGHKDPFNRRPFPWGRENTDLQAHYRRLGRLRQYAQGRLTCVYAGANRLHLQRTAPGYRVDGWFNLNEAQWMIDLDGKGYTPQGNRLLQYGFAVTIKETNKHEERENHLVDMP